MSLINKKQIKAYISEYGCKASSGLYEEIDRELMSIIEDGITRAKFNKRVIVKPGDL